MTADKKSVLIVACDSQVLMWALPWAMHPDKKKKHGKQDVPEMRRRAKLLLRMFEINGRNCTSQVSLFPSCLPASILKSTQGSLPTSKTVFSVLLSI